MKSCVFYDDDDLSLAIQGQEAASDTSLVSVAAVLLALRDVNTQNCAIVKGCQERLVSDAGECGFPRALPSTCA